MPNKKLRIKYAPKVTGFSPNLFEIYEFDTGKVLFTMLTAERLIHYLNSHTEIHLKP